MRVFLLKLPAEASEFNNAVFAFFLRSLVQKQGFNIVVHNNILNDISNLFWYARQIECIPHNIANTGNIAIDEQLYIKQDQTDDLRFCLYAYDNTNNNTISGTNLQFSDIRSSVAFINIDTNIIEEYIDKIYNYHKIRNIAIIHNQDCSQVALDRYEHTKYIGSYCDNKWKFNPF